LYNTVLKSCYHSGAIRSAVTQSHWRYREGQLLNEASNGFPFRKNKRVLKRLFFLRF